MCDVVDGPSTLSSVIYEVNTHPFRGAIPGNYPGVYTHSAVSIDSFEVIFFIVNALLVIFAEGSDFRCIKE